MCRHGPEYGFEPDAVAHINTGAAVPQSRLTAKVFAEMWDLEFIEQGPRNQRNALAPRVLRGGWSGAFPGHPSQPGHGREWANRKAKPMDAVYMMFEGQETWVSGVRKLESKRRSGNVADGAVQSDKPRRTWVSPIVGWTDAEKREYILKHNLPVSEAYLILGFSAECVACAFDDRGLLTDISILSPELAYALQSVATWLYQLAKRGDVDIDPKRLCWGWEPNETADVSDTEPQTQEIVGCSAGSCSTRNAPEWIRNLEPKQIIDRSDVTTIWDGGISEVVDRFREQVRQAQDG